MMNKDRKQSGQGMTEYIIVLQTLYSCGFQRVTV